MPRKNSSIVCTLALAAAGVATAAVLSAGPAHADTASDIAGQICPMLSAPVRTAADAAGTAGMPLPMGLPPGLVGPAFDWFCPDTVKGFVNGDLQRIPGL